MNASLRLRTLLKCIVSGRSQPSLSRKLLSTTTTSTDRILKSKRKHVNGVSFHYEQTGEGDHVVLLLPGALGHSRTDFLPQLNGLDAKKYNIISFDPRGYGKSRPPDRDWPLLFLQRDADDAASFMKALGIPQYSVMGWSDGGITAMILAGANPGSVQRMVIWGCNAYITEKDVELIQNVEDIDQWSPRMKQPYLDIYGEEYFRKHWKSWVEAYKNYFFQRNGDICIDSVKNIKCPTLLVSGHKDALVPQEHAVYLQKHIANCRTVDWPEGKHNLHLRYFQEFNSLAEDFLDGKA